MFLIDYTKLTPFLVLKVDVVRSVNCWMILVEWMSCHSSSISINLVLLPSAHLPTTHFILPEIWTSNFFQKWLIFFQTNSQWFSMIFFAPFWMRLWPEESLQADSLLISFCEGLAPHSESIKQTYTYNTHRAVREWILRAPASPSWTHPAPTPTPSLPVHPLPPSHLPTSTTSKARLQASLQFSILLSKHVWEGILPACLMCLS